ncbi:hypothetical protein Ddc_15350 [Ditylenchus destructor]|nr:hypothetical protein Ddc_15350 [Ditylenchus destructor]
MMDIRVAPKNECEKTEYYPRDIGVLVVVDNSSRLDSYELAQKTLKCYCAAQNYSFEMIHLKEDANYSSKCPQSNFYLQRHCATVEYMKMNPHLKWVLFLDGDIGVINPTHEIEEFIHERTDAEIELIFFERLITWEIMAGAYLAKNTPFVHDFLSEWANYVSNEVFHQDDQGPLHQVLMRKFLPSKEKFSLCEQFYNSSKDFGSYLDYVACARYFLGINTRSFGSHIKLIRRGDAWVRDGQDLATSLWSDRDFMFHCWKESHQSWIRPFTKKNAFQLENCRLNPNRTREAVFAENWQYDPKLKKTDHEIEAIIDKIRNMSIKNYEWALKKIRISR